MKNITKHPAKIVVYGTVHINRVIYAVPVLPPKHLGDIVLLDGHGFAKRPKFVGDRYVVVSGDVREKHEESKQNKIESHEIEKKTVISTDSPTAVANAITAPAQTQI